MSSLIALQPSAIISSSSPSSLAAFSHRWSSPNPFSLSTATLRAFPSIRLSHSLGFCLNKRMDAIGADTCLPELEAEIYYFMEKSKNPENFPTREELILSGRADLADAVAREGGWLAYGWDLEQGEEGEDDRVSWTRGQDSCPYSPDDLM